MLQSGTTPHPEVVSRLEAELRVLARHCFAGERRDHTLQPTALVSEVWLRLAAMEEYDFADLTAFRAWASGTIRRILVDHARRKQAAKRGGRLSRLGASDIPAPAPSPDLASLDLALLDLEEQYPRAARVVELRFFGGMTYPEVARTLHVSERTARNDWTFARAWLRGRIDDGQSDT